VKKNLMSYRIHTSDLIGNRIQKAKNLLFRTRGRLKGDRNRALPLHPNYHPNNICNNFDADPKP
jgi:hypothetical protein